MPVGILPTQDVAKLFPRLLIQLSSTILNAKSKKQAYIPRKLIHERAPVMESLNISRSRQGKTTGWKKAAKINCIILVCMSITLISSLIVAIVFNGGFRKALVFYDGSCDGGTVSQVNTALHLLINIASTLMVNHSPPSLSLTLANILSTVGNDHHVIEWLDI